MRGIVRSLDVPAADAASTEPAHGAIAQLTELVADSRLSGPLPASSLTAPRSHHARA